VRIALIQSNPLVGDLRGNTAALLGDACQAAAAGAQLALAPELALWGYPPRDLLLQQDLVELQDQQLDHLAASLPPELALLLGVVERQPRAMHNALALVHEQQWKVVARKRLLPSYDVFDERRYFTPGQEPGLLELKLQGQPPLRLGLSLCEDLWVDEAITGQPQPSCDPIAALVPLHPQLLINLSASPYAQGKARRRKQLAAAAASRLGCPVVYVNQVGGNDELIFDGSSFVVNTSGSRCCQLPCAERSVALWNTREPLSQALDDLSPEAEIWRMLVLGVQDYASKCGFRSALLGLSGGIDSALVATVAVAALGAQQVRALLLPSPYSSNGSIDDAQALAECLQLRTTTVPIAELMGIYDDSLTPALGVVPAGVTAENLQSRIRGTLLMAVANAEGQLLLATGNKSELAVGYCTLYGDMNGGLAVIGDLYKTEVYGLARWLDSPAAAKERVRCGLPAEGHLIGHAIREKPPSAELRPDQRDSDSLPDYPALDRLLRSLIEEHAGPAQLIDAGEDPQTVEQVWRLLKRSEFKRRQAAPVLKLSEQAFGSGWRMPIAAGTGITAAKSPR
jgi:NAD+ synthase (glutamine-hydrolysing)